MKFQKTIACIFLMTLLSHSPAIALNNPRFASNEDLREWMTHLSPPEGLHSSIVASDPPSMVARFYQLVGYRPVWTGPEGLLPQGKLLLQTITNASAAGLSLNDYFLPTPETTLVDTPHRPDDRLPKKIEPYIQLDVFLTRGLLRYARHLSQGIVNPEQIYQVWLAQKRSMIRDIPAELAVALKKDCLVSYLESLHPQSEAYQDLRRAVWQYEKIRRAGGWLPIASGPTLKMGDTGPRVAMLKYRLGVTGDRTDDRSIENDRFDKRLVEAVKRFQHRHGLDEDGRVGKETLAELNVPVQTRIGQLQLNMERWRWFPDSFGDRYLMVNIPAFTLTIVNRAERTGNIRVIVGKKDRQTPIMSDRMTYIEFNPYWNIPQKIARRDILPKIIHDPSYLIRQGIRVFDSWDSQAQALDPATIAWDRLSSRYFPYRLRQDPSDSNALGQVKFMFPNQHSIYIHDTPGKALFDRQDRIFSSGCVRIEEPITLAHALLRDQGWNRDRIEAITSRRQRKSVMLAHPLPVHLVYFTAWVDADGSVNFRKDIYGRDARIFQALQHPSSDLVVRAAPDENKTLPAISSAATDVVGLTAEAAVPDGDLSYHTSRPSDRVAASTTGI